MEQAYFAYIFLFFLIALGVIGGFIMVRNEVQCSFCGGIKIGRSKWYRKGPYLHPEYIVNCCNDCKKEGKKYFGEK